MNIMRGASRHCAWWAGLAVAGRASERAGGRLCWLVHAAVSEPTEGGQQQRKGGMGAWGRTGLLCSGVLEGASLWAAVCACAGASLCA